MVQHPWWQVNVLLRKRLEVRPRAQLPWRRLLVLEWASLCRQAGADVDQGATRLEWYRIPLHERAEVGIASGQQVEGIWWQLRLSDLHIGQGDLLSRGLDQARVVGRLGFLASQLQAKQEVDLQFEQPRQDIACRCAHEWPDSLGHRRKEPWLDELEWYHLLCICSTVGIAAGQQVASIRRRLRFTELHSCERLV